MYKCLIVWSACKWLCRHIAHPPTPMLQDNVSQRALDVETWMMELERQMMASMRDTLKRWVRTVTHCMYLPVVCQ